MNYWRNRVLKAAKDFNSFHFTISDKDGFQHEISEFGLDYTDGDKPVVIALKNRHKSSTRCSETL